MKTQTQTKPETLVVEFRGALRVLRGCELRTGPDQHLYATVDDVDYYVHDDITGYRFLTRTAEGQDYGGNVIHAARTAPEPLFGITAPIHRGHPLRLVFGEPAFVLIDNGGA